MREIALRKKIEDTASGMNADFVGIANAACFENPEYTGNKPQDVMVSVQSVIILGVGVPKGAFDTLPAGRAEYTNTLMAATATLRIAAFQIAKIIEKEGYRATIVPTEGSEFGYWYADRKTLKANLSIKYAAYHAGLGNFGMNHLLITKDFGPRVRMTAILTDAPLEREEKSDLLPFINEKCSSCMKCIEVCPAGAISQNGEIDREKCAQYMFNVLGGLRCGLCVKVCPM